MVKFDWQYNDLTPSQQKIAQYIERNIQQIMLLTEQEIADTLQISVASVSRFWRAVGYDNMKDFKLKTSERMTPTPARKIESLLDQNKEQGPVTTSIHTAIHNLELTLEHFDEESLDQASQLIEEASKIYIYGQGSSAGLKNLLYFRLARFGLTIQRIDQAGSEMLEDIVHMKSQDLLIMFSFGMKALPEEKVLLQEARDKGFKLIIITDQLVSANNEEADVTLFGSRGEEWEFHSMVVPTLILEMLVTHVSAKMKDESLSRLEDIRKIRKKYHKTLPR